MTKTKIQKRNVQIYQPIPKEKDIAKKITSEIKLPKKFVKNRSVKHVVLTKSTSYRKLKEFLASKHVKQIIKKKKMEKKNGESVSNQHSLTKVYTDSVVK